ncbi:MAG TPA: PaaI family thioesterase [Gaiellaceae bacterium]|nr:PaaI family thioesterase [Gaiellaceae bacterium]
MSREHLWERLSPDVIHIWNTLGYRSAGETDGVVALEWDAGDEYSFLHGDRRVVHGGMVATLLDTSMGYVCVSRLPEGQAFLTADLHVEFYRVAAPGTLRAEAEVVHQSRRAFFCAASLYDAERALLASARCTQIVREAS